MGFWKQSLPSPEYTRRGADHRYQIAVALGLHPEDAKSGSLQKESNALHQPISIEIKNKLRVLRNGMPCARRNQGLRHVG
jgi:hypothetical protein